MRSFLSLLTFFILTSLFPSIAHVESEIDGSPVFTFTFENDVFRNTDRSYTNGVRFSWISGEEHLPTIVESAFTHLLNPLAERLPFLPEIGNRRISYALGQSMFTPNDITQITLDRNDRPYAGWLYGTVGLTNDYDNELDYFGLTLGVVGPGALAEQTQSFVHEHITNSPIPQGWHHQLKTEPGFIIDYEHKWRHIYQTDSHGIECDFTPHIGVALGNIHTHASVGGTIRVGNDLPADYGPPRVRPSIAGSDFFIPSKTINWYFFAGIEGRAVAHNIFLDGNTWRSSHSVNKKPFVADLQFGVATTYDNIRIAYTNVHRTKAYDTQAKADQFGTLSLSIKF